MPAASTHACASQPQQLATFMVGDLLFGIPVAEVQEVIRFQALTTVPLASPVVRGLLNLRGQIITAIDMRRRLSIANPSPDDETMNVIVDFDEQRVSLLVDSVGDVLELSKESFEPTPATVTGELRTVCRGVHKLANKLLLVLDTETALHV
jgi:purine-binding chemotaxis protein CheW